VYVGLCNHFNIGALMEKGLTVASGQAPVQRYWKQLLGMIEAGKLARARACWPPPPCLFFLVALII
jgi:threonine dehydrogenase-like Zn-dependent dehydrogenase